MVFIKVYDFIGVIKIVENIFKVQIHLILVVKGLTAQISHSRNFSNKLIFIKRTHSQSIYKIKRKWRHVIVLSSFCTVSWTTAHALFLEILFLFDLAQFRFKIFISTKGNPVVSTYILVIYVIMAEKVKNIFKIELNNFLLKKKNLGI